MLMPLMLFAFLAVEPLVDASGFIRDELGALIPGARIIYHRDPTDMPNDKVWDDGGKSEGTVLSDRNGSYTAKVHPGIYDVCVMMNVFTPQCRKVEVQARSPHFPVFHLKVDPIVEKYIGDSFK